MRQPWHFPSSVEGDDQFVATVLAPARRKEYLAHLERRRTIVTALIVIQSALVFALHILSSQIALEINFFDLLLLVVTYGFLFKERTEADARIKKIQLFSLTKLDLESVTATQKPNNLLTAVKDFQRKNTT